MTTKDIILFAVGGLAILFFATKAKQTTMPITVRPKDAEQLRTLKYQ